MPSARRGPAEDRGVMMDRILRVARRSFAYNGSAGTTMRAVAIEAGVDPSLVTYYFADKISLLDACLQPPPGYLDKIKEVARAPLRSRGKALVANMLSYWEDAETADTLRAIVMTAMHEPVALDRLRGIYRNQIVAAVSENLADEQRQLRANLAASQIVGLCMTRYIYKFEPLASMSPESVRQLVGPVVQRYLNGALPVDTASLLD